MEKVIVWADNIHIMNNNSGIKRPIAKEFISAGNYIKEKLKEKVYSLGTIHANDSLYYMGQWEPTPIEEDSFEAILSEKNAPYLFVSSNQELMKRPFKTQSWSEDYSSDFFVIKTFFLIIIPKETYE